MFPLSELLHMPKSSNKTIKALGKKIQKLRKKRGWTQEELAEMLGFSRVYMGYIEQGRETPSLNLLIKLARKLGVKPEELFRK